MIFRLPLITKILTGEKTQTRRPVKDGKPCRYLVGGDYAVQPGRGKRGVARIRVTAVRREQLRDLTAEDAVAEGFATPRDLYDYWTQLYGTHSVFDEVWVISFELVQETRAGGGAA